MPYALYDRSSADDSLFNAVTMALDNDWLLVDARVGGLDGQPWPDTVPVFSDGDYAILQPPVVVAALGGDHLQLYMDKSGTPIIESRWHRLNGGAGVAWDVGAHAPDAAATTVVLAASTTAVVVDRTICYVDDRTLVILDVEAASGDPGSHLVVGYMDSLYRDVSQVVPWALGSANVDPWPFYSLDGLTFTGKSISLADASLDVAVLDPQSGALAGRTVAISSAPTVLHYPVVRALIALSAGAEDLRGALPRGFLSSTDKKQTLLFDRIAEVEYLKVQDWAYGPL